MYMIVIVWRHNNDMKLYDRPVSNHYNDNTLKMYPVIETNESYKRLFFHLSFTKGQFRDETSGMILLSESILAMIEEKESQLENNHYNGSKFLESFKKDVLPEFEWSGFSNAANKARAVISTGFNAEYQQLLDAEKDRVWNNTGRIYFLSKKAYNRANREAQRVLQRKDAFNLMKATENEDAIMLADYLNNLDSRGFTAIVQRNIEDAIVAAKNLVFKPVRKMNENKRLQIERNIRERNLNILAEIETQAQPFYKPVQGTNRLFTINAHIGSLNTEIREVLTRGWVEVDLRSSQLAITATLWNVTDVIEFIQRGGSIWYELFVTYNIAPSDPNLDSIKRAFKESLYAILFGAEAKDVQRHLTNALKEFGVKQRGDIFMNHWIIKSMVEGRDKEMNRIKALGGDYTVYGKWLSTGDDLTTTNISSTYYDVKSIIAQQAQAVELKIIASLFRLAAGNNDFTIQLYQFDGVSIRFHNKNKESEYLDMMKDEVKVMAESLGIPIELVVK